MNLIELNHISKTFSSNEVLKDISLSIPKGELFGLLGPSGAGKTTLIKILTGQIRPTSGTASLFEKNCYDLDQQTYQQIGMVLDNCGIYERLSCYDNLALFSKIYNIKKSRIKDLLNQVDLQDAIKIRAGKLSKGMRQRLVLARAMLHNPKLLFLDEPTSGLDPTTSMQIHTLLYDMQKAGTTIFLTTHNMEEASKLCNHIALLNEGKIVEYGVPDEICRKYNKQNDITILCKNGTQVTFPNSKESASQIAQYFENNLVEAIHSSEPNLETVFITLTGRRLCQ